MDAINYEKQGAVFNMQRFSVRDGRGIRTVVFLKGCPLKCPWCSNPESQSIKPVLMYQEINCIHCGRCISTCKQGAISPANEEFIDRSKCIACGECAAVCPAQALQMKGKYMTVAECIKELKKDALAFRRSKGGVTLSGGEALVQHDFSTELLKACQSQGWDTAMETTGYASEAVIEQVFPYVNTALLDIKSMNAEKHKNILGVDNAIIHRNARRIAEITNVIIRVPVIPGFNYDPEDIRAIAEFAKTLNGVTMLHLLPYHSLGSNKYKLLGRKYELPEENLHKEDMIELEAIVNQAGLDCVIGG